MKWRIVIAVCSALSAAPTPRADAQPAALPVAADAAPRDPAAILLDRNPEIPRASRMEAARRLVQRDTPQDRQALANALQEQSNPTIQAVAATALAEDGSPDPMFVDALFVLIQPGVPIDVARPAGKVLGKFKNAPVVLQRLIERTQAVTGEPSRRAAIEALGSFPEKRAAERLIALLAAPDESSDIRASAAKALTDMTGATENGTDVGRWQAWWQNNVGLGEAEFRAALQVAKANQFEQLKPQFDALAAAMRDELSQMYRALPPDRREEQLLKLLRSGEAVVRAVGAMIVREDKASAAIVPESVQEQLKGMVGDLDESVRLNVATALGALNYSPALDPILLQLGAEPNPDVRAALIRAISPMQDLRAVPALLALLADNDRAVARAAAVALRDLGPKVRERSDAGVLARVTAELKTALQRTAGVAGAEALREAVVDAMIPLRQPDLILDLSRLLRAGETEVVRRNAIRALAAFGDEKLADNIAPMLSDRVPAVRLAAAIALGELGRAADIAALQRTLKDPDPSVQAAAWNAIVATIAKDSTPAARLYSLADDFKEPTDESRSRRLAVLLALQNKLDPSDAERLAEVRQNIAAEYMRSDPPQAADAIEYCRLSLENYKQTASAMGIEKMTGELIRAYLIAGRYADAIAFGGQAVTEKSNYAETIGREIKKEVDRLSRLKEYAKAEDLIVTSETMSPPLADVTRKALIEVQTENRRAIEEAKREGTTAPTGPRTAIKRMPVAPFIPVM